jgi:hypothetical protein
MKKYFIKYKIIHRAVIILTGIVFFAATMQSCSDAFDDDPYITDTDIVSQTNWEESLTWEERLEKIMNTPPNIMVNSGIELLGYEIISDNIDNTIDENRYKEAIKADENMIPLYSDDMKFVTALTKRNAILKSSLHQTFHFEKGDEFVDNMNLKGAKILKLKWNNNGTETNTVCIVSDKDGILYDNFLSHCFENETEESIVVSQNEATDSIIKTPRLKAGTEAPLNGTISWSLTGKLTNISSGSVLASVQISHTASYYNGNLCFHYASCFPLSLGGSAHGKARTINSNTIAYGYGLSPLSSISIQITEYGSSYNVQIIPDNIANVYRIGSHYF